MKKDLNEILDTLTPEELDTLPEELFQAEQLDDVTLKRIKTAVAEQTGLSFGTKEDTVTETDNTVPVQKAARRTSGTFRRILAAAACVALLLSTGAGVYAYAAARKEYKNALTFFYEQNLSTEGLTKNEIKEVYRDFYSHSFTNELTTDVLLNSRPDLVRGYEITGDTAEWDSTVPETSISDYKTPVYYEFERLYTPIEGTYNPNTGAYTETFDKSIFTKYCNNEKVWELTFEDIRIYGYYGDPENDKEPVIVYGGGLASDDSKDEIATLVALDTDGTILWETVQNNLPGSENIDVLLANLDGTYTAFGTCAADNAQKNNYLCVNKYDKDGTPISSNLIDIKDHFIENVTPTSTGYLAYISSYVTIEFSRVLKLDSEGNLLGDFRYESEEHDFFISDLCEYNGTVYISGYATPKPPKNYRNYRMRDLYALRDKMHDASFHTKGYTDAELLSLFREQFTAVLLVCEPDSGTPKEFYSVAGSLGDEVYVTDGSVCWFTKDIIDSSYSADVDIGDFGVTVTDANYAILCRFYANTFHTDGTFKEQKKLDLMTERHWP
ncbi:MAG: hypothetical protein IJZ55_06130 [Lachnospiraceae bacterium]|nr:hypothetical protein [Lachnospiraceae bacterium]